MPQFDLRFSGGVELTGDKRAERIGLQQPFSGSWWRSSGPFE